MSQIGKNEAGVEKLPSDTARDPPPTVHQQHAYQQESQLFIHSSESGGGREAGKRKLWLSQGPSQFPGYICISHQVSPRTLGILKAAINKRINGVKNKEYVLLGYWLGV